MIYVYSIIAIFSTLEYHYIVSSLERGFFEKLKYKSENLKCSYEVKQIPETNINKKECS